METETVPTTEITVRRNAGLAGAIGAVAAVVAILYLSRALGSGAVLDWALCLAMGAVAAAWLQAFVDARTPLLVADAQGLRVRRGRSWEGMPWADVDALEHLPRSGLLRDGRLEVFPLVGEPLSVPLSLSTRVIGVDGADLTAALDALADGTAEVAEVYDDYTADPADPSTPEPDPEPVDEPAESAQASADPAEISTGERTEERRVPDPRPWLAHAITRVSRLRRTPEVDEPVEPVEPVEVAAAEVATPTPEPVREPVTATRVEVLPQEDDVEHTAVRALRSPGRVDLVEEALPEVGSDVEHTAVAALRIDDLETPEPAPDPVIGPQLAAARERLRLSVDQLAERTRIRPHVIESIEVDDFAPCGGDFYARGHLRTLARVVGIDVAPLLEAYDERYADAPVDARRVFEAELATGAGSIRGTRGGPSWSVLVAAVMVLVLAWSVAQLFLDGPIARDDEPVLNGSAGLSSTDTGSTTATLVRLDAAGGGAAVKVVDGNGKTVFSGDLAFGQVKLLKKVRTPVEVTSSDGSLQVALGDGDAEAVGETGQRGVRTYVVRNR